MTPRCARCQTGPVERAGHEDLYTQSFVGSDVMLKCRDCGTLWTRTYATASRFVWAPADQADGALLPSGKR